jgi:hypothetical protein
MYAHGSEANPCTSVASLETKWKGIRSFCAGMLSCSPDILEWDKQRRANVRTVVQVMTSFTCLSCALHACARYQAAIQSTAAFVAHDTSAALSRTLAKQASTLNRGDNAGLHPKHPRDVPNSPGKPSEMHDARSPSGLIGRVRRVSRCMCKFSHI